MVLYGFTVYGFSLYRRRSHWYRTPNATGGRDTTNILSLSDTVDRTVRPSVQGTGTGTMTGTGTVHVLHTNMLPACTNTKP